MDLSQLGGVATDLFLRRFGGPPEAFLGPELAELRRRGLILDQAGRIRLSETGILFADEVFMGLLGR